MKKVLFILSLLLGSMNFISAQTPLSFSKVINVDGVNDKQLYERLETFLTNAFNHPDKVIQLRDKENKSLTVKTSFIYKCIKKNAGNINRGVISYTINIACKDGRFKISIFDFEHKSDRFSNASPCDWGVIYSDIECPDIKIMFATKKWKKEIYDDMKEKASEESNAMISIFENAAKQATQAQESNW